MQKQEWPEYSGPPATIRILPAPQRSATPSLFVVKSLPVQLATASQSCYNQARNQSSGAAVPVRIVGEQAYRIKEFRLRFYEQENMVQPSLEVRTRCLSAFRRDVPVMGTFR